MRRERRLDLHRSDRQRLADVELGHVAESPPRQDPADPARHDEGRPRADPAERPRIEMVVVCMREQHGVDRSQSVRVNRCAAPQVLHEQPQQRVGEQPHAVERDQHRRVPDPPHARLAVLHATIVGRPTARRPAFGRAPLPPAAQGQVTLCHVRSCGSFPGRAAAPGESSDATQAGAPAEPVR